MSKSAEYPFCDNQSTSLIEPDTWYVSYRIARTSERGYARATRRFKSEANAKAFALEAIRNGGSAIAGTINPYNPKRIIPSRQVLNWIAE
jgi:hypothetical protein